MRSMSQFRNNDYHHDNKSDSDELDSEVGFPSVPNDPNLYYCISEQIYNSHINNHLKDQTLLTSINSMDLFPCQNIFTFGKRLTRLHLKAINSLLIDYKPLKAYPYNESFHQFRMVTGSGKYCCYLFDCNNNASSIRTTFTYRTTNFPLRLKQQWLKQKLETDELKQLIAASKDTKPYYCSQSTENCEFDYINKEVHNYNIGHKSTSGITSQNYLGIFSGSKGTCSRFHLDKIPQFSTTYIGRKLWFIFDIREAFDVISPSKDNNSEFNILQQLNQFNIDWLFQLKSFQWTIVHPNQYLYLAPWAVHAVFNIDDSIGISLPYCAADLIPKWINFIENGVNLFNFPSIPFKPFLQCVEQQLCQDNYKAWIKENSLINSELIFELNTLFSIHNPRVREMKPIIHYKPNSNITEYEWEYLEIINIIGKGKGVIAKRDIPAQYRIEFIGKYMNSDQHQNKLNNLRAKDPNANFEYMHQVNKQLYIDGDPDLKENYNRINANIAAMINEHLQPKK